MKFLRSWKFRLLLFFAVVGPGFITANASLAMNDVNIVLIPEVPFKLEGPNGLFKYIESRLLERNHAFVLVAEGAGQNLFPNAGKEHDASGNAKLEDIGVYLKKEICAYFGFRVENQQLFAGVSTVSRIGVLAPPHVAAASR